MTGCSSNSLFQEAKILQNHRGLREVAAETTTQDRNRRAAVTMKALRQDYSLGRFGGRFGEASWTKTSIEKRMERIINNKSNDFKTKSLGRITRFGRIHLEPRSKDQEARSKNQWMMSGI